MYLVNHLYEDFVNGIFIVREEPILAFREEKDAEDYADRYGDGIPYKFADGIACIFGHLEAEEVEEEEIDPRLDVYGPGEEPDGPDFPGFERKRKAYLASLEELDRVGTLVLKDADCACDGDHVYEMQAADEGPDVIYRESVLANNIGRVAASRDILKDARERGYDTRFGVAGSLLERIYEKIIYE